MLTNAAIKVLLRRLAFKIVPTPYMADSITQGTLASWEKSKIPRNNIFC